MLCGCQGDLWLVQSLMADEVERSFYSAWLFCSLLGHFHSLVISNDVCVAFEFVDGNGEPILVVILGGWVSYVVEEKIYVLEAICEYECIQWECFGVFRGDQECV